MDMIETWIEAKKTEAEAIVSRRVAEDAMIKHYKVKDGFEGTQSQTEDGFKVKITGRLNRKVNADLLQEIAADNGLTEHLSTLFSWKPSLNMAAWKNSSEEITKPLLGAITTTLGRPTFKIEKEL